METCYTYDYATKQLSPAKNPATINGAAVFNPTPAMYALIGAYPISDTVESVSPPEGKVAVPDGYEVRDGKWVRSYRFEDAPPAPVPTLEDYDAAMEEHLRGERMARGYTTREPDAYITSSVARWKQDAEDWVTHRDAVMTYAQQILNEVKAGTREAPTLEEFTAGLPQIEWSYTE